MDLTALRFVVHGPDRRIMGATVHAEDAAMMVATLGEGATVRDRETALTLWTEGAEEIPAGESADDAAETMHERQRRSRAR